MPCCTRYDRRHADCYRVERTEANAAGAANLTFLISSWARHGDDSEWEFPTGMRNGSGGMQFGDGVGRSRGRTPRDLVMVAPAAPLIAFRSY